MKNKNIFVLIYIQIAIGIFAIISGILALYINSKIFIIVSIVLCAVIAFISFINLSKNIRIK